MEPSATSFCLNIEALVRLPLCAHAKPPTDKSANSGCIFFKIESPVVEYLTCPIAFLPGSREIISGLLKLSPTKPGLLTPLNLSPSKVTIPAPSWPRCCRACKPKVVKVEASGLPKIPKTPHSSCSLSSLQFL